MERKNTFQDIVSRIKGVAGGEAAVYAKESAADKGTYGKILINGLIHGRTELLKCIIFFVFGAFSGGAQSLMGSYPFGTALICAVRRHAVFVYAGTVLAAVLSGSEMFPILISSTVSFGLRILFAHILGDREQGGDTVKSDGIIMKIRSDPDYFSEPVGLRCAAAAIGAFAGGMLRVIFGGFLYFDIFGTVFQMIAASAACYLLTGLTVKDRRFTVYYEAGICAAVFIAVSSLKAFSFFGFSVSAVVGFFITLYAAQAGGMLRGGIIGLFCGLACGAAESPVFAVAGLTSGLFMGIGKVASIAAASVTGVAMELWLGGIGTLGTVAPDIVAASVILTPLAKFGLLPEISVGCRTSSLPDSVANDAAVSEGRRIDSKEHIEAVSEAFSALSQLCSTLSNQFKKPGIYETRMLCAEIFDKSCRHCASNAVCFDKNYESMAEAMDVLARRLRKNGRLEPDDLPDMLKKICASPEDIISEANLRYARLEHKIAERDKTEIFAMDYESVAKILENASKEDDSEYEIDRELSEKICDAVGYLDFYANNIAVFGKRRLRIVAGGVDLGRVRVSSDEILHACENICMRRLSPPEFHVEEDYVTMTMASAPMLSMEVASVSLEKKDESVCGDSALDFDSADGRSYMLISDGMGSGHEAAITSRVAGIFMKRMLEAGSGINCTLELLNNFIRCRNAECFATIDLLEIDTLTAEARFIKSGAAPSYVIREGSLFKIASGTIPVGITREINAEQIKFRLERGDVVVMVSDGVAQTLEDSAWLADIIIGGWEEDIKKLAQKILDAAMVRNQRRDDMTVGLVKIGAA